MQDTRYINLNRRANLGRIAMLLVLICLIVIPFAAEILIMMISRHECINVACLVCERIQKLNVGNAVIDELIAFALVSFFIAICLIAVATIPVRRSFIFAKSATLAGTKVRMNN